MNFLGTLSDGSYRGRGLALGLAPDGEQLAIVYWITGRSARSRNRRLVELTNGTLCTEFIDTTRRDNPALVVYPLLMNLGVTYAISNGEHTKPILEAVNSGDTLERAIQEWTVEPDELNTPRIVGTASVKSPDSCRIGLVRTSVSTGRTVTERCVFSYSGLLPGSGRCITTYAGGSMEPTPFVGDPLSVTFEGNVDATCARFRDALAGPLLVSVAARFVGHGKCYTAIANLQE
jgi:IMP cyclohydrolase